MLRSRSSKPSRRVAKRSIRASKRRCSERDDRPDGSAARPQLEADGRRRGDVGEDRHEEQAAGPRPRGSPCPRSGTRPAGRPRWPARARSSSARGTADAAPGPTGPRPRTPPLWPVPARRRRRRRPAASTRKTPGTRVFPAAPSRRLLPRVALSVRHEGPGRRVYPLLHLGHGGEVPRVVSHETARCGVERDRRGGSCHTPLGRERVDGEPGATCCHWASATGTCARRWRRCAASRPTTTAPAA